MLMQFTVANFLSFDEEQTFSMLAADHVPPDKHPAHVITDPNGGPSLVRAAAIYGANASGKSNLVKAIAFARKLVLEGTRPNQSIPVTPFKLRPEAAKEPSKFGFVVRHEGVQYEYGFLVDRHRVHEEWLFQTRPGAEEEMLFQRLTGGEGSIEVETGPALYGKKSEERIWAARLRDTRVNQLFLASLHEGSETNWLPIIRFFNSIAAIGPESNHMALESMLHSHPEEGRFLSRLLASAGTKIDAIKTVPIPLDYTGIKLSEDVAYGLTTFLAGNTDADAIALVGDEDNRITVIRDANGEAQQIKLKFGHPNQEQKEILFDLGEESDGTQRFINIAVLLFDLYRHPVTIIIDELDRRLHPFLSQLFLETALAVPEGQETPQSQLIFTTHETRLLHPALLRPDEVWFTEKEKTGATKLYSLAEFPIPEDLSWEKGYLNGRFGAIPFVTVPLDLRDAGFAEPATSPLGSVSREK